MADGFPQIACAAAIDSSSIMKFIVGPVGDASQKNLGHKAASITAEMTTCAPRPCVVACRDDEQVTVGMPPPHCRAAQSGDGIVVFTPA
jgi:hypothetical protein